MPNYIFIFVFERLFVNKIYYGLNISKLMPYPPPKNWVKNGFNSILFFCFYFFWGRILLKLVNIFVYISKERLFVEVSVSLVYLLIGCNWLKFRLIW